MAAEEQVEAFANKLQELNVFFDGKETHTIENGVVTELRFLTENVSDISPVRALTGLKVLNCPWQRREHKTLAQPVTAPRHGLDIVGLHPIEYLT